MLVLAAIAPILLILVLMIGLRMSAAGAGMLGLATAVAAAVGLFGFGVDGELGAAAALGGTALEGLFLALTILWILFAALSLHELQTRRGAIDLLRGSIARLTADRPIAAVLVGWFFALFIEGAAGFGTPVALSAPILVAMGFSPIRAVSIALLGHAAGVAFGAIGTPVLAQTAITGIEAREIARYTGLLAAPLGIVLMVLLFRNARAEAPTAAARPLGGWQWAAGAALCFLVPFAAIAAWIGPELPTLAGALLGGLVFVAALKLLAGRARPAEAAPAASLPLLRAALPYLVVIVLILATRLIPGVRTVVTEAAWSWRLNGTFTGSVQPLHHPGTLLLLGLIAGGLLQGASPADLGSAMGRAARRLVPVTAALVAMLVLSRVMVHSGMIDTLATAAAAAAGTAWPLFAPAVGALGSFVTGSATASNVLFSSLQRTAALEIALPATAMLAGQGAGAAIGNIICPHNVIAGTATVGLAGREGEILRRTIPACLAYVVLGGLLLYAATRWFGP